MMIYRRLLIGLFFSLGLTALIAPDAFAWPRLRRHRHACQCQATKVPAEVEAVLQQLRARLPGKTDDQIIQVLRGYVTNDDSTEKNGLRWMAERLQRAKQQREAVQALKMAAVWVRYDYQVDASGDWVDDAEPPTPEWLRDVTGVDLLSDVVVVFNAGRVHLRYLPQLGRLRELFINDRMEDADLTVLHGLNALEKLDIYHILVSKEAMQKLQKALPNCKIGWHCGDPT